MRYVVVQHGISILRAIGAAPEAVSLVALNQAIWPRHFPPVPPGGTAPRRWPTVSCQADDGPRTIRALSLEQDQCKVPMSVIFKAWPAMERTGLPLDDKYFDACVESREVVCVFPKPRHRSSSAL